MLASQPIPMPATFARREADGATDKPDEDQPVAVPAARHISIRLLLFAYVLLVVIPAWGFAGYMAQQYAANQRASIENAGRRTAQTVASAVDFRLTSIEAALAVLALSPRLAQNDYAAFYEEARALAARQGIVVALLGTDGTQRFNTSIDFGQVLPDANESTQFDQAVETGRTQFSRAFFGTLTRRWLVTMAVPVRVAEEPVRHVLIAGIDTMLQWGEVLGKIDLPPQWAAAVIDEANVITARWPDPLSHVGTPVRDDVAAVLAQSREGQGTGTAVDGREVQFFFTGLQRAPWRVIVGIPRETAESALRDAVMPVVLAGFALLLASLLSAWMIGRRFTQQLVTVAGAAMAYRGGARPKPGQPTRILELAELKRTLEEASRERDDFEERLRALIEDKDLLMQEVHHRVKNSLQLVRGVLSLQARGEEDPKAKAALSAAAARILTVADVHQHLYQGHSTAEAHVGRYLEDLVADLARSLIGQESARRIIVEAPDVIWPSEKLTALGLIMTELVTNAVKYGAGVVQVRLSIASDGAATLVVEDQGKGFPEGYELGQGKGLGSKLITSLVRPQDGTVTVDRLVPYGRVIVQFNASWRSDKRDAEEAG